jgi:hypothetical protein
VSLASLPSTAPRHRTAPWERQLALGGVVPPYVVFLLLAVLVGGVGVLRFLAAPGVPTRGAALAGLATALLNGVLVRDRLLARVIHRLLTKVPPSWPLGLRAAICWVFHLGGLHAGWNLVATVWAVVLALAPADLPVDAAWQRFSTVAPLAVLLVLTSTAVPSWRRRHHDLFDGVHVAGPPVLVALLWIEASATSVARGTQVTLLVLTLFLLYPTLLVRRVAVSLQVPSRHVAIVSREDHRDAPGPSASKYSRSRFGGRHGFVNVPGPDRRGWRLVIARAGDWTRDLIDDPPSHLWVRSLPAPASGPATQMFSSVVLAVTGSGIGPALAYLHRPATSFRLVWVTRSPVETYGRELVDEVLRLAPDTVLVDTTVTGKPDVAALVTMVALESGAEAVVTVTNRSLSLRLDEAVRRAGLVPLSPTWDS